jgi:hypothetical protein
MRILIDDKPVEALTPRQEKTFFLSKVQEAVKGRVYTPAEATDFFIAQTRRWYMIVGAIGGVLSLAALIGGVIGEPNSAAFFILLAVLSAGALILFMVLMLRHRVRVFTRKMGHRSEGLMPVGTVYGIDATGLAVGPEAFAWPILAIDTIELTSGSLPSGDTSTPIIVIERLAVAAGPKVFMLDRAMIENGMLLVDNIWRRLRPAGPH